MNLVLVCAGPAACRASLDHDHSYQDHLALNVALDRAPAIALPDGTHLGDHAGTLQIRTPPPDPAAAPDASASNAIFWNDPTKDGRVGVVTLGVASAIPAAVPFAAPCEVAYYAAQLEVSPALYFAILVTMNAPDAQLSLELEVPDLDTAARGETVRFEDLYARGMSRVSAFTLSVTRGGGAREALLPESWPLALGPSGVPMW